MRPAATPCPGQAAPKSEPANATGSREPAKPIRSAVPDGAGPGPAPRPDAGPQTRVSLPCWPTRAFAGKTLPRTVFWPGVRRENPPPDGFLARRSPGKPSPGRFSGPAHPGTGFRGACPVPAPGSPPHPPRGSFLERHLRVRVRLRVPTARPAACETQCRQLLADCPLMQHDAEGLGNPALQILPAPAHHPVPRRVRPRPKPRGPPSGQAPAAGGVAAPTGS